MVNAPASSERPPKPRLVVRVGITGHRTEALKGMEVDLIQLHGVLTALLANIYEGVASARRNHSAVFDDRPWRKQPFHMEASLSERNDPLSEVRLITAIAAGTDSIAAVAALDCGYVVTAVLPFCATEYEKDFTEKVESCRAERDKMLPVAARGEEREKVATTYQLKQSELDTAEQDLDTFRRLRERLVASTVELDNPRNGLDGLPDLNARHEGYAAVGQLLVNHTDLLIAVWNGQRGPNRGGTWRVVAEALRLGTPVVHICPIKQKEGEPAHLEMKVLVGPDELHRRRLKPGDYFATEFTRLLLPPDLWSPSATADNVRDKEELELAAGDADLGVARAERAREAELRSEYHSESYRKWVRGPFTPPRRPRVLSRRLWAWSAATIFGLVTLMLGGVWKFLRDLISGLVWVKVRKARAQARAEAEKDHPGNALGARFRRWWAGHRVFAVWQWLRGCVAIHDAWADWERDWTDVWSKAAGGDVAVFDRVRQVANTEVKAHACWADALAQYYSTLYRSAATLIYMFASLAVAAALTPIVLFFVFGVKSGEDPHGWWVPHELETLWLFVELFLITSVIVLLLGGRRWRWHERYIDYRLIAENLRILRHLLPLGRTAQNTRVPAHDRAGDPTVTWAFWHYRAIVRAAGLIPGRYDPTYVSACTNVWEVYVGKQEKYHRDILDGLRPLLRRLKFIEAMLLVCTVLACIAHVVIHNLFPTWEHAPAFATAMTCLAALLPGVGASLFAWLRFLDAETVEKREHAMERRLAGLRQDLALLVSLFRNGEATRAALLPVVDQAAQVMSDEALDWRVQFAGQALTPPP